MKKPQNAGTSVVEILITYINCLLDKSVLGCGDIHLNMCKH